MKIKDGKLYLSIGEVSKRIKRSTVTIKYWIEWYNEQTEEIQKEYPLPEFRRDLDNRQTRYIEEKDLKLFENFRDSVVYGKLSLYEKQKNLWGG